MAFLLLTSVSFSWNKWLTGWLEATFMANKIWVIKNQGIAAEMINDFRDQDDDQAQLAKDKIVHDTLQIILGEDDLAA
ncbi:MAG: hypothetical protein LKI43_03280 [Lactobacillus delbrueckii]|nr:hypothetical protein [Lactobacillus delbrueckii]MCH4252531.1 hypothetical protein [Lactobacillus delbrueckii]MCI1658750.1 hypothetical protein [Lactobacillus delbrueckii]MCI1706563.1 hypothetical protein [Lactobacillus delbrueckii]